MLASIAVFAEDAHTRGDGKLDVSGVYNCRFVADFPSRLDVTLVLRFEIEPLDYGTLHQIEIRVMDDDAHALVTLRANGLSFDAPASPGLPMAYDMVLPASVSFPGEGTYTFDVRVSGTSAARIPLRVQRVAGRL